MSTVPTYPSSSSAGPSGLSQTSLLPNAASQTSVLPCEYTEYKDPVDVAERKKQKEQKRAKKERKRKRRKQDSKTAAETLLFLGVWNVVMWMVPVLGNRWHEKFFVGFGIGFTKITMSLLYLHVVVECHSFDWSFGLGDREGMLSLSPEQRICKVMQHMNGTHSLQHAKDLACAIPGPSACEMMTSLYYAGFLIIFCFFTSALLSFFASMFLYYYWHNEHLIAVRNMAAFFYVLSPTVGIMGFALHNALSPDIGQLPRSWTAFVQTFNGGTGLGDIKPVGDDVFYNKFGWTWYWAWISIIFSVSTVGVWGIWFKKHEDEEAHENLACDREWEIQDQIMELERQGDMLAYGGTERWEQQQQAWNQGRGARQGHPAGGQPTGNYGAGYGAGQYSQWYPQPQYPQSPAQPQQQYPGYGGY